MTSTVRGHVRVPPGDRPQGPVEVRLRIEDTTRADAAAEVVATERFEVVLPVDGDVALPFEVPVEDARLDEQRTYTIRAHVDCSGSGTVERGDYLTTRIYPVLTHDAPAHLELDVQRI